MLRADCVGGARPCPMVSCKYHLYLDVTPTGGILVNFPESHVINQKKLKKGEPELDVAEALMRMPATCALDVADQGEHTLESVSLCLNVTREWIRQLEHRSLQTLRSVALAQEMHEK